MKEIAINTVIMIGGAWIVFEVITRARRCLEARFGGERVSYWGNCALAAFLLFGFYRYITRGY